MSSQRPTPADGSTERPWTALEAAFEDDGMAWGPNTCEAYRDLERRVKANRQECEKLSAEWDVMLALERRVAREKGMREASQAMSNPRSMREGYR
jgi:hypothetical protein